MNFIFESRDSSLVINYHSGMHASSFHVFLASFPFFFFFLLKECGPQMLPRIFEGRGNSSMIFFFKSSIRQHDDTAFRVVMQLVNGDESKKSKLLADKLNFLS